MQTARAATPTSGALRCARAAVVATATVLLAVAAHRLGGGMAAPAHVVAGLGVGATALTWALSARRWDARALLGVMALAQAALHLTCAWSDEPAMTHAAGSHVEPSSGPLMLLTHAVATLLAVAVVRHGEDVLWTLVETLAVRPLRLLLHLVAAPVLARQPAPRVAPPVPHAALLALATPRRGPPPASVR